MISQASDANGDASSVQELQGVFIATTSEALETEWLRRSLTLADQRVKAKHSDVDLRLWPAEVEAGEVTANRLIEIASEMLGAVVVLTGDDYTNSRGESGAAPRDNLVLETGLFLGRFGLRNVLPLREKDSKWPSDLLGVNFKEFAQSQPDRSAEIVAQDVAGAIVEFVDRLMQTRSSAAGRALLRSSSYIMQQALDLQARTGAAKSDSPIESPNPERVYLDAVNDVKSHFATTTYLTSDFWTSTEIRSLAANEQMLGRIQKAKGDARRLIVLPEPIDDYFATQREQRRAKRAFSQSSVDQMNREFRMLADAHLDLNRQGFEVRVVCDQDRAHSQLPSEILFQPEDTELALYDDSRLDIFSGFASNTKPAVKIFSNEHFDKFRYLSKQFEKYFNHLWESPAGCDFGEFASGMTRMIKESDREIDYTSNWLSAYDAATGEDGELKYAELDFVWKKLRKLYPRDGQAKGHVDLGTCTGRYLRELAKLVASDSPIVGIDNDTDCIDVLNSRKSNGELDSRVDILEADIRLRDRLPAAKFDLVTCMMGTLCHLERQVNGTTEFHDEWQSGLESLAHLLSDDGDAFVAIWDKSLCDARGGRRDLLKIYGHRDSAILCTQTPGTAELKKRLKQVGLEEVGRPILVKNRLRVLHLKQTA